MPRANISDNRVGQQIAGTAAIGQQCADLRGGNGELGHGEGDDAAGRGFGEQRRGFGAPFAVVGGQCRRQAGGVDREARAVGDGDVRQGEQFLPAMPAGHAGEGVGADQQDPRPRSRRPGAQALQRGHRVARNGGLHLAGIDREAGVAGDPRADR